jgi:hypothetical protein
MVTGDVGPGKGTHELMNFRPRLQVKGLAQLSDSYSRPGPDGRIDIFSGDATDHRALEMQLVYFFMFARYMFG